MRECVALRMVTLASLLIGGSNAFQPTHPLSLRDDARRKGASPIASPRIALTMAAPLKLSAQWGGFWEGWGIWGVGGSGGWSGARGDRRAELKAALALAVEVKQGREARSRVEGILEELIALQGPLEKREKLPGLWTLIWSSQTADSNPFAKPSSVLGGDCFQRITPEDGIAEAASARAENLVVWPFLGGLTLNGGATLEPVNATRSILRIDSFRLELGDATLQLLELTKLAPVTLRDAPVVREGSQLVTVSRGNERVLNKREGYLDILYFDDEGLRVTVGDNGLLYAHLLEGCSLT